MGRRVALKLSGEAFALPALQYGIDPATVRRLAGEIAEVAAEGHQVAVVVGAGQAGLAVSYHLRGRGIDHVVLERGHIGESWRSQRWDSFVVNTPNWMNGLPAAPYEGPEPDGFMSRDQLVDSFERHADHEPT